MDLTRRLRRLSVVAAVLLAACFAAEVRVTGPNVPPPPGGGGGGGGPGLTLTITPGGGALTLNAVLQLSITLRDAQGAEIPASTVSWTSSNSAVVTVDATGQVRAVGLGTAGVTASTAGVAAIASFTVVTTPVGSVVLSPSTATLQLSSTSQFTATVRDLSGNTLTGRPLSWSTSNAAVLTVDASGLARAVGVGTATVSAVCEGRVGAASVTVVNVPVASVQVTPATDTVEITRQTQLVATPRDGSGGALSGRVVTWTSLAPTIARVSGNGLIDGLAAGTATIRATSEGVTGTAVITVIPVPVAVVVVVPQAVTVQVGATTVFAGTPRDINGNALTGRTVQWSSADPAIATVSQAGVVGGVAPGTVLISATVEGVVGSAFVTVRTAAATLVRVTIAPQTAALLSGQTQQFSLTGTLSDSSTAPVTGTYQATGGTVNGAGIYTAPDQNGTFLVIGTASGTALRDTATVTVTRPPVATVQVQPATATVNVGQSTGLTATLRDAAGNILTNRVISWSSSNQAAATVNNNGLVNGVAPGTAIVTATSEGRSASSSITVQIVPVASVSVTPSAATVAIPLSTTLTATCRDANGNPLPGRPVSWSTNNAPVATVSTAGVVTAVATGTATITANCEGRTANATITVIVGGGGPGSSCVNAPSGYTTAIDAPMSQTLGIYPNFNSERLLQYQTQSNLRQLSDSSAVRSPSGVIQIRFPAGMSGGAAPARFATPENSVFPSNSGNLYVCVWAKISANWSDNGNAGTKFFFTRSSVGQLNHYVDLSYHGSVTLGYNTQFTGGSNARNMPASGPEIDDNRWHVVELLLLPNTGGGANGTVRMWKDGVLSLNQTDVVLFQSGQSPNWTWIFFDPTYGGGFNQVPQDQFMTIDHLFVSVR